MISTRDDNLPSPEALRFRLLCLEVFFQIGEATDLHPINENEGCSGDVVFIFECIGFPLSLIHI